MGRNKNKHQQKKKLTRLEKTKQAPDNFGPRYYKHDEYTTKKRLITFVLAEMCGGFNSNGWLKRIFSSDIVGNHGVLVQEPALRHPRGGLYMKVGLLM